MLSFWLCLLKASRSLWGKQLTIAKSPSQESDLPTSAQIFLQQVSGLLVGSVSVQVLWKAYVKMELEM